MISILSLYFQAYFLLENKNNFNQLLKKNVIIQHRFGEQKLLFEDLMDLKDWAYKYDAMLFLLEYKWISIHKQHTYLD